MTRSRHHGLAAALLALVLAAFALPIAAAAQSDQDEDTTDFRDEMKTCGSSVERMLADTKAGKNVSEFRLGMFSMSLLNTLGERDPELGAYFHKDGRTMQSYLTDVFQYHDADEVAHVAAMAQVPQSDTVRPAVRMSAKDTLEALRHIPEGKDPPETQAKDREALAATLATLRGDLAKAAEE
jgi:hypothetical protein